MIKCSIIIPVRNQKESLLSAMASLKRQIRRTRQFEIVICDDGSTDGTAEALRRLHYPIFFKYFVNDPPVGRSANRNLGAAKSVGATMIFFDGDMVPGDGYVEAMLEGIEPGQVKVGCVMPAPSASVKKRDSFEKYLYTRGRYALPDEKPLPGRLFTSNSFVICRSDFERIGGFDEHFKGWGGEDIDFGLRLEAAGVSIRYCKKAVTYHQHARLLRTMVADFRSFGKESLGYLLRKHPILTDELPVGFLLVQKNKSVRQRLLRSILLFLANRFALGLAETIVGGTRWIAWPDFIYDYILWGNLAWAYQKQCRAARRP